MRRALLLVAVLALAACDRGSGDGTAISINAHDADGNVTGSFQNGSLAIDAPGFQGAIKLPKIQLDAENFDMNGVHLYPGSKITGMNIDAQDHRGGTDEAAVRVSFRSPADPASVRQWFAERLGKAGYTLHADGNGLSGTTNEDKPFRLELSNAGTNAAEGRIIVSG